MYTDDKATSIDNNFLKTRIDTQGYLISTSKHIRFIFHICRHISLLFALTHINSPILLRNT